MRPPLQNATFGIDNNALPAGLKTGRKGYAMKLYDKNTGHVIATIMTDRSMSIDDCLGLMRYGVSEDGRIYDTDTREEFCAWFDFLEMDYADSETGLYTDTITVDGDVYKMIDEAEVRQELLPDQNEATAYGAWDCIREGDAPDEIGTVPLYTFKYVLLAQEDYENGAEWYDNVDWEAPDDIVVSYYRWDTQSRRTV